MSNNFLFSLIHLNWTCVCIPWFLSPNNVNAASPVLRHTARTILVWTSVSCRSIFRYWWVLSDIWAMLRLARGADDWLVFDFSLSFLFSTWLGLVWLVLWKKSCYFYFLTTTTFVVFSFLLFFLLLQLSFWPLFYVQTYLLWFPPFPHYLTFWNAQCPMIRLMKCCVQSMTFLLSPRSLSTRPQRNEN